MVLVTILSTDVLPFGHLTFSSPYSQSCKRGRAHRNRSRGSDIMVKSGNCVPNKVFNNLTVCPPLAPVCLAAWLNFTVPDTQLCHCARCWIIQLISGIMYIARFGSEGPALSRESLSTNDLQEPI